MTLEHVSSNLRRLRAKAGVTQQDLAEKAGLSRAGYRKIELGESTPRADTVQRLADALDVPLRELVTPANTLRQVRFRSNKQLKRREDVLVEVGRWLASYDEVETLLGEPPSGEAIAEVSRAARSHAVDERLDTWAQGVAAGLRSAFGLDRDEPVHNLCGLLESRGIKVLPLPVQSVGFFGLSVGPEDHGPAVVVNTWERISVERWIFSAAHELAHLVLHLGSYDVAEAKELDEEEREADAVAGYFLLPDPAFRREWERMLGLPLLDRVLRAKRIFRVSWQTIVRRVSMDLPEATRGALWQRFYADYRRRFKRGLTKTEEPFPIGPNDFLRAPPPGPEIEGLGAHDFMAGRLWKLVRRAVLEGEVSLGRGAEILDLSLGQMRDLAATWALEAEAE